MLLSQQSGANIVIADESSLDKRVTVNLNGVSLETALTYVVKCAGAAFHKMAGRDLHHRRTRRPCRRETPEPCSGRYHGGISGRPRQDIRVVKIMLTHSMPSELIGLDKWLPARIVRYGTARYARRRATAARRRATRAAASTIPARPRPGRLHQCDNRPRINSQPVIPTIDPTGHEYGFRQDGGLEHRRGSVSLLGRRAAPATIPTIPARAVRQASVEHQQQATRTFCGPKGCRTPCRSIWTTRSS